MSDTTKRQAYVFLQDGDVIRKHDEFFNGTEWLTTDIDGKLFGYDTCSTVQYSRQIATPAQTEGLTVRDEYAIAYTKNLSRVDWPKQVAVDCTNYANAMMKARAQK
jgi:hypothetical protein